VPVINGVTTIPIPGGPLPGDSAQADRVVDQTALAGFFVGPENRLVELAIHSLLDEKPSPYNPVVFHGPPGTGKSHLAHGLIAVWESCGCRQPGRYVTAIDFARQLADANDTQTLDDFRARYRRTSLLVVEDIELLAQKQSAQRELIDTIDALLDAGGRVVVTCSAAVGRLSGIVPRLQARLLAGLGVPLSLPSLPTRVAILERIAAQRGVTIDADAAGLLASALEVNVPQLSGALMCLEVSARLDGRPIDEEAVRRYLAQHRGKEPPSLRAIALLAAKYFSLKLADLRSASRRREVVTARGVAMYLARALTSKSLEEIGEFFGGRDHTTVSHGCRATEERLKTEPAVRQAVLQLQEKLATG
jgi:chromosomal replication initiator protein